MGFVNSLAEAMCLGEITPLVRHEEGLARQCTGSNEQGEALVYSRARVWSTAGRGFGLQQGEGLVYSRARVWSTAGRGFGLQQGEALVCSRARLWSTATLLPFQRI
jgi:hypothetical protein